jgi:hypothetical protein
MKTTKSMTTDNQEIKNLERTQHMALKKHYHWPFDLITKGIKKPITRIVIILILLGFSNVTFAQNLTDQTIKGVVSDENGPLDQVAVTLKDTDIRTITDKKGMFTFPQALKEYDVLVFSHLGYHTQEINVNPATPFIKIELASESIQILGALQSNKPYKSKRHK